MWTHQQLNATPDSRAVWKQRWSDDFENHVVWTQHKGISKTTKYPKRYSSTVISYIYSNTLHLCFRMCVLYQRTMIFGHPWHLKDRNPLTSAQVRSQDMLTFALWFWNHTWTTLTLRPVSAASVSLTWNNTSINILFHLKLSHIPRHWNNGMKSLPFLHAIHIRWSIVVVFFAIFTCNMHNVVQSFCHFHMQYASDGW